MPFSSILLVVGFPPSFPQPTTKSHKMISYY